MNDLANAAWSRRRMRGFVGTEVRWGMWAVWTNFQKACWMLIAMAVLVRPAAAQLQVGDYTTMSMSGNVGYNYAGSIDQGESSHGNGITGNANLNGNYYSPNFLNFNVSPFYNRTQSDSLFGSLTNTSGVGAGVNLFNGSHFPVLVSYSQLNNSTGSYGIPGSDIGLATHANTKGFALGWSALIPDWPTFTVNYTINDDRETILGETGGNSDNNKTLMMLSSYKIDGWHFSEQFTHRNSDSAFTNYSDPQEGEIHSDTSTNTFNSTAQHKLPWTGNFSSSFTHLGYDYHYEDSYSTSNSGGSNNVNANANFHPVGSLGLSFTTSYNDSLLGSIPEPVLNAGAPLNVVSLGSFQSFLMGSDTYYAPLKNLSFHFDINHVYQTFLGNSYSATQYGGSANYNFERSLLRGLSFSLSVVDTAQQASNTGMGFVGTLNYFRKFSGWDVSGNFSYAQNVATSVLIYTTSSYSYLGSIRRRLGDHAQFMVGYSGSHSGLTANSGTTSTAERVFTTVFYRAYNLNGFYTKSSGEAVFSSSGLVPVTTTLPPGLLNGGGLTLYNSKGYGFGIGASPIRRLTISTAFAKSDGSTVDPIMNTATNNTLINAILQYRMRKIFVNGGYTRLTQDLGLTGTTPVMVTSYYIGFSRWFNFF